MTNQEIDAYIEESKKAVQLSILIPVTPERYYMLNNLYNHLMFQVERGGYLNPKKTEKWDIEIPRMKDGQPVLSDHQTPIVDVFTRSFKHPDIVQILLEKGPESIGEKRNKLLDRALGKYLCFIDSDDWVSNDYVSVVMRAIQSDPDCLSLRGIYTTDGQNPEVFEHSLKYSAWRTTNNTIKYERYPNHLNVIKSDIAKRFRFPDKNFGEDHDWSTLVYKSGLLKTEVYIDQVLYHYKYISRKQVA